MTHPELERFFFFSLLAQFMLLLLMALIDSTVWCDISPKADIQFSRMNLTNFIIEHPFLIGSPSFLFNTQQQQPTARKYLSFIHSLCIMQICCVMQQLVYIDHRMKRISFYAT
jgi:hypothetical protein